MDWFLYDIGLHHERVKLILRIFRLLCQKDYRGTAELNDAFKFLPR